MPVRPITQFNLRTAIGGQPAGSTTFVAYALTRWGYPCGHEAYIYDRENRLWSTVTEKSPPAEDFIADCSYLISQYHVFLPPEVDLLMLVRNPYKILSAHIGIELDHGHSIDINQAIDKICDRWDSLEASRRLSLTFRVEDGLHDLKEFLGLTSPESLPDRTGSHNRGRIKLDLRSLQKFENFDRLVQRARKHGYQDLS